MERSSKPRSNTSNRSNRTNRTECRSCRGLSTSASPHKHVGPAVGGCFSRSTSRSTEVMTIRNPLEMVISSYCHMDGSVDDETQESRPLLDGVEKHGKITERSRPKEGFYWCPRRPRAQRDGYVKSYENSTLSGLLKRRAAQGQVRAFKQVASRGILSSKWC